MLNLGGIANITAIESDINSTLVSRDIGPGNCLIDEWMRKKTGKKFDKDGLTAKIGKINIAILNQALDNHESLKYKNILSYDPKDFEKLIDIVVVWVVSGCTHSFVLLIRKYLYCKLRSNIFI